MSAPNQPPAMGVPLSLIVAACQTSAAQGAGFTLKEDGTLEVTVNAGGLILVPLQHPTSGEVLHAALIPLWIPNPVVSRPSAVLDANGGAARQAQVGLREGLPVRVTLPVDPTKVDPAWLAGLATAASSAVTEAS